MAGRPGRLWLKELTANLGLYGYITQAEPALREVLETVFDVAWAAPADHWRLTALESMSDAVTGDGANYVWFEFGLLVLARHLWQAAGPDALRRLIRLLRGPVTDLDGVLGVLTELTPTATSFIRSWPDFDTSTLEMEQRSGGTGDPAVGDAVRGRFRGGIDGGRTVSPYGRRAQSRTSVPTSPSTGSSLRSITVR